MKIGMRYKSNDDEKTTCYVVVTVVSLPIRFIAQRDCFEKIKLFQSIE